MAGRARFWAAATVEAAARALKDLGYVVEPVRIPVLEANSGLALYVELAVPEIKPCFREVTEGHAASVYKIVADVLAAPNTAPEDYLAAEQSVELLKDGFAAFFQRYDAFLCPVTPIPAHPHGLSKFRDQRCDRLGAAYPKYDIAVQSDRSSRNDIAVRHKQRRAAGGHPTGLAVVRRIHHLHLALLLESVSDIRNLHPEI